MIMNFAYIGIPQNLLGKFIWLKLTFILKQALIETLRREKNYFPKYCNSQLENTLSHTLQGNFHGLDFLRAVFSKNIYMFSSGVQKMNLNNVGKNQALSFL